MQVWYFAISDLCLSWLFHKASSQSSHIWLYLYSLFRLHPWCWLFMTFSVSMLYANAMVSAFTSLREEYKIGSAICLGDKHEKALDSNLRHSVGLQLVQLNSTIIFFRNRCSQTVMKFTFFTNFHQLLYFNAVSF